MGRASLNRLAAAVPNSFGARNAPPPTSLPWARAQTVILDSIVRRVGAAGPQPSGLDEDTALRELLACRDLYSQEPKNLTLYDPDKLKVLRGRVTPKDARRLLPPGTATMLHNFEEFIERDARDPGALDADAAAVRPYWDPRLRASRALRWELYGKLWRACLLGFRTGIKAQIGIFFVKKKNPRRSG